MYSIQRSPETEAAAGEVIPAVVEQELNDPAAEQAEDEQENDQPIYAFDDDDNAEVQKPDAEGGTPSVVAKTVSESEYNKIVNEFNLLKAEYDKIKAQLTHPLVQVAQEYAEAQGVGVELDPVDFIHSAFGLDTNRLSDEEVVRTAIKRDAQMLNVNLTEDELEEEFQSRWNDIEQMGKLKGPSELKKMRESLQGDSKGKLKEVIEAKKADIQKGTEYWQNQYKRVESTFNEMLKAGKKEAGLKMPVDENLILQAQTVISNNFIRFEKDSENVDVNHAIEVAIFASNPKAYIKRIEEAATMRAKRESLKERSAGALTNPSGMPTSINTMKDAPQEMTAWNLKNAKPIGSTQKV